MLNQKQTKATLSISMWHLIQMGLSQLVSETRNKNLTPKARLIAEISKT